MLALQAAGEISELKCQKRFELRVFGVHIANYKADFAYLKRLGDGSVSELVVEDTKGESRGLADEAQGMKLRLMRACHGIKVREVRS